MNKKLPVLLALAALACTAAVAAPAVTQARTQAQAPISPIQHVVVIYLENHSFDNVLGYWCNAHPGRCPAGGMPSSVKLSNGVTVTPSVATDRVVNVDHSVASQVAAIDGGKMDGWQNILNHSCDAATGYRCISGYQPGQIPNITTLAQNFAISDETFSFADSPSWAGHMAMVAASTDHFYGDNPIPAKGVPPKTGWGCDSDKVTPWTGPTGLTQNVPSCIPDPTLGLPNGGAFRQTPVAYIPTIMDRLNTTSTLSWKIYGALKGATGYGLWNICPTFAECLDTPQNANLVSDAQFSKDAATGKLPSFSVVTPGGADFLNSCHNGTSMTACDNWVGTLVGDVQRSRNWASTAIFITWDDCGCFYDHVTPPVEPDGTQEGPRMPMIIVSPFARPGFTDPTPTTFAGILAYTEHTFGLTNLNANDGGAYDFSNAFNYAQAPLKPARMVQRPLPAWAKHIRVTPAMANDPT
jgi:phospholipase C